MLLVLLLSSAVLQAQLLLGQSRQVQFVEIGATAHIPCSAAETIITKRWLSWFKSGKDGRLIFVKSCADYNSQGKFACKDEGRRFGLQISNAQRTDSGFYVCARKWNRSFFGSSLIVGDSYTPSSRVMLLQPPTAPAPQSEQSGHLACLVHGVSCLVQVSWHVPGGLRPEGRTLLVQNSSGSLTFLGLLRVPADSWPKGEPFACEVRFNASSPGIRRNATWPPANISSPGPDEGDSCQSQKVLLAVLSVLGLLLLLASCLWSRPCPGKPGFQLPASGTPSSEEPQAFPPLQNRKTFPTLSYVFRQGLRTGRSGDEPRKGKT